LSIRAAITALYADLGTTLNDDTFVFSYAPDHRRHSDPDAITHRYAKMAADLGIDTRLHALRHYSATELLAGGVDLRTVAGRLGHTGGGATTLKVYAAWLADADTKAADLIASASPDHARYLMSRCNAKPVTATAGTRHKPGEPITARVTGSSVLWSGQTRV
jgi:integrase